MAALLLTNANVLDPDRGVILEGHHVRIENERIREVSDRPIAAGAAETVDLGGRTLMPGLIDAHVHVALTTMDLAGMTRKPAMLVAIEAAAIMKRMLHRGFTTVRDAAGAVRGLAMAVERGLIEGPRLFYAGRALSQTGGHGDFRPLDDQPTVCPCAVFTSGISHVADGVASVRAAAREELRQGSSQVKIMASGGVASPSDPVWNVQYSAEEMRAIVEEAQGWRTYAMAHAYTPEAITRAVEAGVRTIEHGNLIDEPTARLMAARGAFLVPTLVTYFKIDELGRQLGMPAVSMRKVADVLDAGLASLERCRDAGVAMGFGTDLLGETHDAQSEEFTIRARVLPPADVIRSATTVNAEILGRTGELGVVAEGAVADLLVVDGDPLRDISVLTGQGEHLPGIVQNGRWVVRRLD